MIISLKTYTHYIIIIHTICNNIIRLVYSSVVLFNVDIEWNKMQKNNEKLTTTCKNEYEIDLRKPPSFYLINYWKKHLKSSIGKKKEKNYIKTSYKKKIIILRSIYKLQEDLHFALLIRLEKPDNKHKKKRLR